MNASNIHIYSNLISICLVQAAWCFTHRSARQIGPGKRKGTKRSEHFEKVFRVAKPVVTGEALECTVWMHTIGMPTHCRLAANVHGGISIYLSTPEHAPQCVLKCTFYVSQHTLQLASQYAHQYAPQHTPQYVLQHTPAGVSADQQKRLKLGRHFL